MLVWNIEAPISIHDDREKQKLHSKTTIVVLRNNHDDGAYDHENVDGGGEDKDDHDKDDKDD